LALVLAFPLFVLIRSHELANLAPGRIFERQALHPEGSVFGPAYSNCVSDYKLAAIRKTWPRVMIFGSSRMMQFRAGFFAPDARFYNAAGIFGRIERFRNLLAAIPRESQPEWIVIGLDPEHFNPAWSDENSELTRPIVFRERCDNALNLIQRNWLTVYEDARKGKFTLGGLARADLSRRFGLEAATRNDGFRVDGSYQRGRYEMPDPAIPSSEKRLGETLGRVKSGTSRFQFGDRVHEGAVAELRLFLGEARARGIHVTAFVSPYAPTAWKAMRASGKFEYVGKILPAIEPDFREQGFRVHDFADGATLGATDEEFVDGFHGSELTSLRILLRVTEAEGSAAAPYVSIPALRAIMAGARHPFSTLLKER
jgi:hypothetical protein